MPKISPAQRTLMYTVTPSSGSATADIDIAKDLSTINRRLYRQGMQYHISDISVSRTDVSGLSHVSIFTAGDTWMVHNAWKKAYALWRSQLKEVEDVMPGLQGKWSDFKIELDDNSGTAATAITPQDGQALSPDEWNLSNYVWDDDGTERSPTFCLLGASAVNTKIGMVQEYHISRAQVQSEPALVADASDSIYAKSLGTDEMSDTLIDLVETESDNAPYDMNEMIGGDTAADCPLYQDYFSVSGAAGRALSKSFTAECGLIRLKLDSIDASGNASDVAHFVTITVTPGPYRGVLAVPMGQ